MANSCMAASLAEEFLNLTMEEFIKVLSTIIKVMAQER